LPVAGVAGEVSSSDASSTETDATGGWRVNDAVVIGDRLLVVVLHEAFPCLVSPLHRSWPRFASTAWRVAIAQTSSSSCSL
jgi:hypothetical protein